MRATIQVKQSFCFPMTPFQRPSITERCTRLQGVGFGLCMPDCTLDAGAAAIGRVGATSPTGDTTLTTLWTYCLMRPAPVRDPVDSDPRTLNGRKSFRVGADGLIHVPLCYGFMNFDRFHGSCLFRVLIFSVGTKVWIFVASWLMGAYPSEKTQL